MSDDNENAASSSNPPAGQSDGTKPEVESACPAVAPPGSGPDPLEAGAGADPAQSAELNPPTPPLERYRCHKIVHAAKILEIDRRIDDDDTHFGLLTNCGEVLVTIDWSNRFNPLPGCYYVEYEDGYCSISPGPAFEKGYTIEPLQPVPAEDTEPPHIATHGEAEQLIKRTQIARVAHTVLREFAFEAGGRIQRPWDRLPENEIDEVLMHVEFILNQPSEYTSASLHDLWMAELKSSGRVPTGGPRVSWENLPVPYRYAQTITVSIVRALA